MGFAPTAAEAAVYYGSVAGASNNWLTTLYYPNTDFSGSGQAPSAGNDYVHMPPGTTSTYRLSTWNSAGGSANAQFPGNSLTLGNGGAGAWLQFKQAAGETASINGGNGDLIVTSAYRITGGPNYYDGSTAVSILDVGLFNITAGNVNIQIQQESGASRIAGLRIAGTLTGAGSFNTSGMGLRQDGTRPTLQFDAIDAFTGNISIGANNRLLLGNDYAFSGTLTLAAGAQLDITGRSFSFGEGKLIAGTSSVATGSYTADELNSALGASFFVGNGVVVVPEPGTLALLTLSAAALLVRRRKA